MKKLGMVLLNDYDVRIRVNKHNLFCYSAKQLNKKYLNCDDYEVIGETSSNNRKKAYAILERDYGKGLRVSRRGRISRLKYKECGYICVGENQYVLLLKSRLPFFAAFVFGCAMLACIICICCHLLMGNAERNIEIMPYNPLPEVDKAAVEIDDPVPDSTKAASNANGQKVVRMQYTSAAVINLSNGSIMIDMNNPSDSTHSMVLGLYIESDEGDVKIAESGLIPSGHALPAMQMIENAAILHEGLYRGKYLLSFYDPSTGEKAIVDSWISNVQIVVQE